MICKWSGTNFLASRMLLLCNRVLLSRINLITRKRAFSAILYNGVCLGCGWSININLRTLSEFYYFSIRENWKNWKRNGGIWIRRDSNVKNRITNRMVSAFIISVCAFFQYCFCQLFRFLTSCKFEKFISNVSSERKIATEIF